MKLKFLIVSLSVAICLCTALVVCAANETMTKPDEPEVKTDESKKKALLNELETRTGISFKNAPIAFAPEPKFQFQSAMDSAEIIHDFILQNKGNAPLTIQKVKTG